MPILTSLLASGCIVIAGLTGVIHPGVADTAPHAKTVATAAVASTTSAFGVSNYVNGQTVSSTSFSLRGTGEPGSRVLLVRGSRVMGVATTNATGHWTMVRYAELDQGINAMTFVIDSADGSRSEVPFSLTVASAPVVKTAAVTARLSSVWFLSDSVTSEARPIIEGLATPGASISVNEPSGAIIGSTVADSSGMFSLRLTADLKHGYNELGLKQWLNGASNVTSAALTYAG